MPNDAERARKIAGLWAETPYHRDCLADDLEGTFAAMRAEATAPLEARIKMLVKQQVQESERANKLEDQLNVAREQLSTAWKQMQALEEENARLRSLMDSQGAEVVAELEDWDARIQALEAMVAAQHVERNKWKERALIVADERRTLEEERDNADRALQQISLSLGGADEWTDQATMIEYVINLVSARLSALIASAMLKLQPICSTSAIIGDGSAQCMTTTLPAVSFSLH
jgi:hypothetical protein